MTDTRNFDEILDTLDLPGDGQVDRKRIVMQPGRWELFDPFLMMAEDWFTEPGFDWHPHRGIETVTFVLAGRQRHGDSMGTDSELGPNDAQWMTAGRGIIHREVAVGADQVHSLQLWLNLSAADKMTEPRQQNLLRAELPSVLDQAGTVTVYAGRHGAAHAPTHLHQPAQLLDLQLTGDGTIELEVDPTWRIIAYVLDGALTDGFRRADAGQVTVSHPDSGRLTLGAGAPARALVFSGLPIRESVVQRGPFVMNNDQQIDQAINDYRAGRLAPFPSTRV